MDSLRRKRCLEASVGSAEKRRSVWHIPLTHRLRMGKRVDRYGYEIPDECLEWCPHCECEVDIATARVVKCPTEDCGYHIRACAVCDEHDDCDWRNDGYCRKYPNFRYKKYDHHGEILEDPNTPMEMLAKVIDALKCKASWEDAVYYCPICDGDARTGGWQRRCRPTCKLDKMLREYKDGRKNS